MKKYFIIDLIIFLGFINIYNVCAQNNDYEAWAKKKRESYDKWKKQRAEIIGHLPSNPAMDAVGSFIDAGFGNASVPEATHSNAGANSHNTNNQIANTSNMKVWVVVVGVADYEYINKLKYTKDDAYKMYAFYKSPEGGSLPDNQIQVFIDEDATRTNIMKALNDVYSKATQDDAIVFYFSGHGSTGAFITDEYDGSSANNKGLLLHEEINNLFDKSPAKYKYIIADACHSGSFAQKGTKSSISAKQAYYQSFENSKGGFVLLLSSMSDEYSMETSGIRQGVFSHFLLRGLKGEADTNRDNVISVVELFDFVESNVTAYTQYKQNPVLFGNYDEQLPIATVR